MLTDKYLVKERDHLDGIQRIYKFPSGYGLSLVNAPVLHSYSFAWEAAVLSPKNDLDYTTPLTSDVEVFNTDDETNAFIERAINEIGGVQ